MGTILSLFTVVILASIVGCGGDGGSDAATPVATPTALHTSTPEVTSAPRAVAWAAGAEILKSEDGGAHWLRPGLAALHRLAFVDRDTGWAIGSESAIVHTVDGGRHWIDQRENIVGRTAVLQDVAARDAMHAVIVGSEDPRLGPDPLQHGPPAALVTSDAGATWSRAVLNGIDAQSSRDVRLLGVCLTGGGIGLATGRDFAGHTPAIILVTHDAGATWENITTRLPRRPGAAVACTPEEQLWVFGGESSLSRSSDGGLTWRDAGDDLPPGRVLHGLTFVDASTGWIVAEDPVGPPSPSGAASRIVVLDTRDGGMSWRERPVSDGHVELTLAIDFLDASHGVIVAQDEHPFQFPRSSFGLSFFTEDGGASWTETILPEPIDALWDVELFP